MRTKMTLVLTAITLALAQPARRTASHKIRFDMVLSFWKEAPQYTRVRQHTERLSVCSTVAGWFRPSLTRLEKLLAPRGRPPHNGVVARRER